MGVWLQLDNRGNLRAAATHGHVRAIRAWGVGKWGLIGAWRLAYRWRREKIGDPASFAEADAALDVALDRYRQAGGKVWAVIEQERKAA